MKFIAHGHTFEIIAFTLICSTGMLIHVPLLSIHEVLSLGNSFAVILTESALQFPNILHSLPHSHIHTHKAPQVPLLVVQCTPGGGGLHILTLLEHNYCMLEGQLEVIILKKEEEQTTSVYQSSHNTLPTLLGCRLDEHTYMGLSIRLEVVLVIMDHFVLSMSTMFHVQCVTLQHKELL